MSQLTQILRACLANTFIMYFRAQSYHWNVEGIHFSQYHDFFGKIYSDTQSAVDPLAEYIRIEGEFAPVSLAELYNHSAIKEDEAVVTSVEDMLKSIYEANAIVLTSLDKAFELADEANRQGLADFIASRIDVHKKHEWMLRVSMKGN